MLRKLLFVVSIAAFTFAACGRQVTPDRTTTPSGLASGFMQVKFTTAQPLDFTNVRYVIMFNTTATGGMPYANGYLNNYANYSFAIVVGGNGTASNVQVIQYVTQQGSGTAPFPTPVIYSSLQLQFTQPAANQFVVTFDRRLFNGVAPTPTPAGPNPNLWYANWFTTNGSFQPIDAPGLGGPQDTSFTFPPSGTPGFDVSTTFDQQWTAVAGWPQVNPSSAQIVGGEIINTK